MDPWFISFNPKTKLIAGSTSKSVVDGSLPKYRHKNTATEDDDGVYEGVECRNVTTPKRRKSESPTKIEKSNSDNRLSDKSTQTGMEDEDEEKKKKKQDGNCVIL